MRKEIGVIGNISISKAENQNASSAGGRLFIYYLKS